MFSDHLTPETGLSFMKLGTIPGHSRAFTDTLLFSTLLHFIFFLCYPILHVLPLLGFRALGQLTHFYSFRILWVVAVMMSHSKLCSISTLSASNDDRLLCRFTSDCAFRQVWKLRLQWSSARTTTALQPTRSSAEDHVF